MEQKNVRILSDFSFPNFVGVGLDPDFHVNLLDWIQSLEKHSPLISGLYSVLLGLGV